MMTIAASSVAKARPSTVTRRPVGATLAPFVGLAVVSAVQAWEWLFSGLTKLQNDAFIHGFMAFVGRVPGPYGRFMVSMTRLAPGLLPRLVEATELTLGLSLAGATLVLLLPHRGARRIAILVAGGASLVGVVLAVNIAVLAGSRAPWRLGMAPFSTGVPVEALLAGISLAGVAEAYSALLVASKAHLRTAPGRQRRRAQH
ncbi:MAG: hypothetical protein ABR598_09320 [Candidatus Dormibacteria bacterium]